MLGLFATYYHELWRVWDFPLLLRKELTCHSFMEAGRRLETSEAEMSHFFTLSWDRSSLSCLLPSVFFQVPQGEKEGLMDISVLCAASQLRNLEFRNLNLLCWPITAPAFLPQGIAISLLHGLFATKTSLTEQSRMKWWSVPLLTDPEKIAS